MGIWLLWLPMVTRGPKQEVLFGNVYGLPVLLRALRGFQELFPRVSAFFVFLGPRSRELCEASRSCSQECQHFLFSWARSAKSFARLPGGVATSTSKAQMAVARTILRFARLPNGH